MASGSMACPHSSMNMCLKYPGCRSELTSLKDKNKKNINSNSHNIEEFFVNNILTLLLKCGYLMKRILLHSQQK